MKCPRCKSTRTNKNGTRPIRRKNAKGKRNQAYICYECNHQWEVK